MTTALIIGISGQDGAFLAELLLAKGYSVWGTSRDADAQSFSNLEALSIRSRVRLRSMNTLELGSILGFLADVRVDEIYNLGGQSSVGLSFEQPSETLTSIVMGTQNILEALRTTRSKARFYSATSSDCFGDVGTIRADETTPFRPCSPYGVAKASAFWQVSSYREGYGLFAISGLLFNHESRFRPARFVTSKILHAAHRIAAGSNERLRLGNLEIVRDWGHAPEYVDAMWRMMQQDEPRDLVIATGQSMRLRDFAEAAFDACGLDLDAHLDIDEGLFRPNEIRNSYGNSAEAARRLGWEAKLKGRQLLHRLVADTAPEPAST